MAQSVERILGKDEVTGSIPVSSSKPKTNWSWAFLCLIPFSQFIYLPSPPQYGHGARFHIDRYSRFFLPVHCCVAPFLHGEPPSGVAGDSFSDVLMRPLLSNSMWRSRMHPLLLGLFTFRTAN